MYNIRQHATKNHFDKCMCNVALQRQLCRAFTGQCIYYGHLSIYERVLIKNYKVILVKLSFKHKCNKYFW